MNRAPRVLWLLAICTALGALAPSWAPTAAQSGDPCAGLDNPIACENAKPGSPSFEWDIDGAGDASIQGFATDISVNRGQTIRFKIDTDATDYRLDIYRMGYYNGLGARKVATVQPSVPLPQSQPDCLDDVTTGLVDCGNWAVSAQWAVPGDAVSGIYFAKVIDELNSDASHIVFVVRDDTGGADLLFQTADTTWQAYNRYGGNSLYVGSPAGRAYKVSYNRPFTTREYAPEDWVFNAEYPMVRWLEANGYNVSYIAGLDPDRFGTSIFLTAQGQKKHQAFLSVGHDEYWSGPQRASVEAARGAGMHLAFFSGNEVFWKTRWESSIAPGGSAFRTLVSYKETHANAKIDPSPEWTGTWRDPRFSPPGDGGRPENALTGTIFTVNCCDEAIEVPEAFGKHRFWRSTTIASLAPGQVATLPFGTLGYEWDEDLDNGFRPAGLVRLSDTVASGQVLLDYGSTYATRSARHSLTLYRHPSGALVFGAGSVQYSWGLDGDHDRSHIGSQTSQDLRQATVNLFADMNAQPLTLQSGLVPASASTDTLAPAVAIASPVAGATVPQSSTFTISGTATDAGGGIVAGVEVSLDGGATWRRANGGATWSYAWQTGAPRNVSLLARATDDSSNLGAPSAPVTVTVGNVPLSCPCSIWTPGQAPGNPSEPDASAVEVGLKFRTSVAGFISGVRFYKSAENTGTHTANLWTSNGVLLETALFTSETASGWQQVDFATPAPVAADTTYIVSYHTTTGFYSQDPGYFSAGPVSNGPLTALADGEDGGNGVYRYGSGFPVSNGEGSNYWVDVVFVTTAPPDTTPPAITTRSPGPNASAISATASVKTTFTEALNQATVSSSTYQLRGPGSVLVPALVTWNGSTRTATLQPSAALAYSTSYTVTVRGGASGVKDLAGNALPADVTWTFSTGGPPPPPPTEGPGGPILVVYSPANPFGQYYAEILRAEGLNSFAVANISTVTSTMLAGYDVVILGETALTAAQVTMFTNWVSGGGNLIAMRPDKQLASLLGLADAGTTLAEGYLLIDTASAPGTGLVNQTIQYHGTADRYTLAGATSVATLYSTASAATTNPAVTVRTVGSAGGTAVAFTYDLAKSVVQTRQGNPAWSGQERDGITPVRSNDLFFGNGQPDWVDLNKVAIPQADEQQRLLAKLVGFVNADRKPLPQFWYFPRGLKAVVVMTGDDHAINGTAGQFDTFKSSSPTGCSVIDWECVRATSYIYPNTPLSNAAAAAYVADGFEIGVHISTNCADYTPASVNTNYANDIASFLSAYPSISSVVTNRTHCIVWSDYTSQAEVAEAHGVRLDTNYYYYPGSWVNNRPGVFTGSGMAMRFAKADGTLIDVYQAATQMTDESGQAYPFHADALLDRALGPEGYYGAFVTNMHTDHASHAGADAIVASAQSRGVPVISAEQLLTWLDGRNGSAFQGVTWNGSRLNFTVTVGAGAVGLQAMLPFQTTAGPLSTIERNGVAVPFTTETIKGVTYAMFAAAGGAYEAVYAPDTTAPVITGVAAAPGISTASITWSTSEPATSVVNYGLSAGALNQTATVSGLRTAHTVSLAGLAEGTTYFYRVTSADASNNSASAPPTAASFATGSLSCPCTIWNPGQAPVNASEPDSSAVEIGVRFRTLFDGYIAGVRFYKGPQNTGTHTANLWTSSGVLLETATFANETASGWQQVNFANAVPVSAGTTYVVSYHTPTGHYAQDTGYFASGLTNGPLRALADGEDGPNGVFRYGGSAFPSSDGGGSNYWVDVVYVTTLPPDTTAPSVRTQTPRANAAAVSATTPVKATFSERLDPNTVNTTTFQLRGPGNVLVSAGVVWDSITRTATLQPNVALAYTSAFTATVRGGPSGVKDLAGNALPGDVTWSFTTAGPPPPPPTEGHGGPILIVYSPGNRFGQYYAEILRAEGLNTFAVADIATVTSTVLANYDVVVLGEMPLSAAQVSMFSSWVTGGGNLIAMRPDKQLASLLGLSDAASTLAESYLRINTASSPGAGLVSDTIQFHGTADRYTTAGATVVATLYSNASTATSNPAVTMRSVGASGGTAVAFTYDLARSVVYTRQGNPAWSGIERDGIAPLRSDDLFFGGSEPDYVDLNKVAIPQADEQQRLLANLINYVNADKKPLPRFWYFPRGLKAVVVMTGDDHANNGTTPQFDTFKSVSTPGCSVIDWECVRGTSYIYPETPLTNAQVAAYLADGFEIGVHVQTNCANYTPASVDANYSNGIASLLANFPAIPAVTTNRTHCIVWSDYTSQAEVAAARGVRLDTNYYYYPGSWVNNRPGVFTGSGMPMRFAKADGTLIDVYQAATQMTDESGQSYPFHSDMLLDRALGPEGYYGAFVANMHTDFPVHAGANAIIASAQARGVPVITAEQLLVWTDGRNGSTFDNLTWNGSRLDFTVVVGTGAVGLQALLPFDSPIGQLATLMRNGTAVPFTTQTIKGVAYAVFSAAAGDYQAQYAPDTAPPVISNIGASTTISTATITWTTSEPSTSVVSYGLSAGALTQTASAPGLGAQHSVTITGLAEGTTYFYRVTSHDASNNGASAPATAATFVTKAFGVTDTTVAEFSAGTGDTGIYIGQAGDGEVLLQPAVGAEFSGAALPAGWTAAPWGAGGGVTVSGGNASVTGALLATDAFFGAPRSLEFVATFTPSPFQHIGFGITLNETRWAMFSTGSGGGTLAARTHNGTTATDTPLGGAWLGTPHRYRIDWDATSVVFSIDGTVVATHAVAIVDTLRPVVSDFVTTDNPLLVDWIRVVPYATTGTFTSRVLDAGSSRTWRSMLWTADAPASSGLGMSARFGNTPVPDASWTPFMAVGYPGGGVTATSRYVQYRALLSGDTAATPTLMDVTISVGAPLPDTTAPVVSNVVATPGSTSAAITWTTSEPSTSVVRYGLSAGALTQSASVGGLATSHAVTLTGLAEGTTYYFTVTSADAAANEATAPVPPASFVTGITPPVSVTDTSVTDFSAGTGDAGIYVGQTTDGEVVLQPQVGAEFAGVGLPAGWSSAEWAPGGGGVVGAGSLSVDGGRVNTDAVFASDLALDFRATFSGAPFQHVGLGFTLEQSLWAIFSTGSGGTLLARTHNGSVATDTPIAGNWLNAPHTYRVEWLPGSVLFLIDGTVVATHSVAIGTTMRPLVSDAIVGDGAVQVDWMRLSPYASSGTFTSRVLDAGSSQTWDTMSWVAQEPAATSLAMAVRFGNTAEPDASWTSFSPVSVSGATIAGTSRYVQYRATLTGSGASTPLLDSVTISAAAPTPMASIADLALPEGTAGNTAASMSVTLSRPTNRIVTIPYATSDGTAVAGVDYTAAAGTLTFAPGEVAKTIDVVVLGDPVFEANETFSVDLSPPVNATLGRGQAAATIVNDDPTPAIAIAGVAVSEGNSGTSQATLNVTLSNPSSQTITVAYATAAGTATAGSDFTAASGTLTFAAGVTQQTVSVAVLGDTASEADESFTVNLSGATNATIAQPQATVTVLNDDAASTLSIGSVTVAEGSTGSATATFTVTLSPAVPSQTITVAYATANGTAAAGQDYTAASGTLTFAPGVTSRPIAVTVTSDLLDELNETFVVNLSNPVNAVLGTAQGTATITDDDAAPSLSIGNASVTEGNSGTVNAAFSVTLSAASGQVVTVGYATANGTATSPADYTPGSGTLTFTPGTTTQTVNVPVVGDTSDEANETFTVTLSAPVNATIATAQGIGTIEDDDVPSFSVNDVNVTETEATVTATFTVTLSTAATTTATVDYATANATAVSGADYTTAAGTLSFPAGTLTRTFTVNVLGDLLNEDNETFLINLTAPVNAVIADAQGTGTIANDDPLPSIAIADLAGPEGTGGNFTGSITVTLSPASGRTVTVNYALANGTATAGQDFIAASGTLTFPAGTTSQAFPVTVIGDALDEADETALITLSGAVNATIADAQAVGTIQDDDASPTIAINNVSITEGNSGSANAVFTVSLSAASGRSITVNYATANGTATAGQDFTTTSGTLTFPAGTTSLSVNVPVLGNVTSEPTETFVVNLSGATNATIADAQGVGTILDNDQPSLSINDVTVTEGNTGNVTATFTVSLSSPASQTVTVNYATVAGTAAANVDFTSTSGTLSFSVGSTTRTVAVTVRPDTLDEDNETFVVNLSGGTNATIADAQGVGTITDNDATPSLVINNVTVTEGNTGSANATFTVTLSAASGRTVTVNYATANSTATAGQDFSSASGTLTFTPGGGTTRTVAVAVLGDLLDEANETFVVNLSGAVNAGINDSQGQGTINDNDATPSLVINNVSATEGDSGTKAFTFTVTLSAASGRTVTVNYATANGSASGGTSGSADYIPTSGTLTFNTGQTTQNITVQVRGDNTPESNQTFAVNLSGASNATIADSQGVGTIQNDD